MSLVKLIATKRNSKSKRLNYKKGDHYEKNVSYNTADYIE
jgi:hypothetical protein